MRSNLAAALLLASCNASGGWCQKLNVAIPGGMYVSDPAASGGEVYVCSDNGKLYGFRTSDGSAISGFPVDFAAFAGQGVFPASRPGIYYGALGKAIYVETSKHGIAKILPDGKLGWFQPLDGASPMTGICTPAVTAQGDVIAEMKTSNNVYLVNLRESDGAVVMTSPPLGQGYYNSISSPAIVGGYIYTTVYYYPAAGLHMNVTVLNLSDLTVRASLFGSGFATTAPFVRDGSVYFGSGLTSGAPVFKMNAVTLTPDDQFGAGSDPATFPGTTRLLPWNVDGISEVCGSPTSTDRNPGGTIYASVGGGAQARAVAIDAVSGYVHVLVDGLGYGSRGMVVSPRGVAAFGADRNLLLFSAYSGNGTLQNLPGLPSRPVYDATTNRFFLTTAPDGGYSYLLGFDSPPG